MGKHRENVSIGTFGEIYISGRIASMNIPVSYGTSSDLTIWDAMQVECKTARLNSYRSNGDKGYQFCIEKKNSQTIGEAAFLILLCLVPDEPFAYHPAFVIPASILNGIRKICIPNQDPVAYKGKWAEFYEKWDMLNLDS